MESDRASTDIDHERHAKDFSDQLKEIVTKENLEAKCKEYQTKLGYFSESEFVVDVNGKILVQNVSVT